MPPPPDRPPALPFAGKIEEEPRPRRWKGDTVDQEQYANLINRLEALTLAVLSVRAQLAAGPTRLDSQQVAHAKKADELAQQASQVLTFGS